MTGSFLDFVLCVVAAMIIYRVIIIMIGVATGILRYRFGLSKSAHILDKNLEELRMWNKTNVVQNVRTDEKGNLMKMEKVIMVAIVALAVGVLIGVIVRPGDLDKSEKNNEHLLTVISSLQYENGSLGDTIKKLRDKNEDLKCQRSDAQDLYRECATWRNVFDYTVEQASGSDWVLTPPTEEGWYSVRSYDNLHLEECEFGHNQYGVENVLCFTHMQDGDEEPCSTIECDGYEWGRRLQ
jgi:cell division protein FtsL